MLPCESVITLVAGCLIWGCTGLANTCRTAPGSLASSTATSTMLFLAQLGLHTESTTWIWISNVVVLLMFKIFCLKRKTLPEAPGVFAFEFSYGGDKRRHQDAQGWLPPTERSTQQKAAQLICQCGERPQSRVAGDRPFGCLNRYPELGGRCRGRRRALPEGSSEGDGDTRSYKVLTELLASWCP